MISYEDFMTYYDGQLWNHPAFSRESVQKIAGREISDEEYNGLFIMVGYITDDLGEYNSISFYEDAGVLTHGNDALVTKKKLMEIIIELIDHYVHYDQRYEKFIGNCVREFQKACDKLK